MFSIFSFNFLVIDSRSRQKLPITTTTVIFYMDAMSFLKFVTVVCLAAHDFQPATVSGLIKLS